MDRAARRNRRRQAGTLFADSYDGIGAESASGPGSPPLAVTLSLFALQILVSGYVIFTAALSGFIVDSCGERNCNFPLIEFAGWTAPLGIVAIFAFCVGLCIRRYSLSRATWWIPLGGICASLLVLLASIGLLHWGVGPAGI
ncbi:hypothetical protein F1C58_09510 [Glaciihabitans sp. INWT7]|uniref:hypothetical protein n=1 Tax=Glaciihabitans sp. INWT7 TaxID=2596912 RepID=UPI00162984C7|nr:hypothetical protein [Glaciihabitans sp. INWT7]QNE47112.1 hypothetical protein F1C58_09510 [Glaciihabitans sp. INWT7]